MRVYVYVHMADQWGNLPKKFQFLTSRVSTPVPFRPTHVREFSQSELAALDQLNLNSPVGLHSPASPDKQGVNGVHHGSPLAKFGGGGGGAASGAGAGETEKVDFGKLEREAEAVERQREIVIGKVEENGERG